MSFCRVSSSVVTASFAMFPPMRYVQGARGLIYLENSLGPKTYSVVPTSSVVLGDLYFVGSPESHGEIDYLVLR